MYIQTIINRIMINVSNQQININQKYLMKKFKKDLFRNKDNIIDNRKEIIIKNKGYFVFNLSKFFDTSIYKKFMFKSDILKIFTQFYSEIMNIDLDEIEKITFIKPHSEKSKKIVLYIVFFYG